MKPALVELRHFEYISFLFGHLVTSSSFILSSLSRDDLQEPVGDSSTVKVEVSRFENNLITTDKAQIVIIFAGTVVTFRYIFHLHILLSDFRS